MTTPRRYRATVAGPVGETVKPRAPMSARDEAAMLLRFAEACDGRGLTPRIARASRDALLIAKVGLISNGFEAEFRARMEEIEGGGDG